MKPARRRAGLLLAVGLALALPPAARAEEVRLRSGTSYEAVRVELIPGAAAGEGDVRFTVRLGGGTATLLLPWDRLDPDSLLALVAARTDLTTGAGHLALARLALDRGLLPQATRSLRRAAEVDPALAGERDAGLGAVRDVLGARALAAAEGDLARGRSDLALEKARDVAAGRAPDDPLAVRALSVADLASRVLARDRAQREALEAARAKATEDLAARVRAGTVARADASAEGAVRERERAADPDLDADGAQRVLETAEVRLKEARRLLATLSGAPEAERPGIEGRDRAIADLLVDTWLDLADLHRVGRRFDRARAYARAAGVLAPDDARVGEMRDRIDRDAAAPLPEPWEPSFDAGFVGGWVQGGGWGWGGAAVARPCAPLVRRPFVPPVVRPVLRGPWNWPVGW